MKFLVTLALLVSFMSLLAADPQHPAPQSTKSALDNTIPWQNIDADELELRGHNMRRVGVSLLVPGLLLTTLGGVALIVAAANEEESPATVGAALMGGSMIFNIPAAAFIVTGGGRIRDAKRIRQARKKYSVGFAPIINPKKRVYGASFAVNF